MTAGARALGPTAAALWLLACVAWFEPMADLRPPWLTAMAPWLMAGAVGSGLLFCVSRARPGGTQDARPDPIGPIGLVLLATVLFRLPLAWHGAAGYVTPDGALSGIVALHVRDGVERLVFVPRVPYSGSLKSHLTAPLAAVVDPARAFALTSLAFYVLAVAGTVRLAERVVREGGAPAGTPVAAGLFLAMAPAFVTRYSLSNDGNYVEVLGLGAWALLLALRWREEPEARPRLAWATGVLLGLAFWCHILAVMHVAAVGLAMLAWRARDGLRAVPRLAAGFALGYAPGLLWNARNGWESLRYVLPGAQPVGRIEEGPGLGGRLLGMATTQWPVLLGYDYGYPEPWNAALLVASLAGLALAGAGIVLAARDARRAEAPTLRLLLLFTVVCTVVAALGLPLITGNPRYLLFLMVPLPIFMARVGLRPLLALLVAVNALASLAQAASTVRTDAATRRFVADLQAAGITACATDFFLATKVNFVSEERIACSAELGPNTTEYFDVFRERVAAAPRVAFVAVNGAAADKLERRLDRLGVRSTRLELMKPVIVPERRVEVAEVWAARLDQASSPSDSR
jgi:hypothetical protein